MQNSNPSHNPSPFTPPLSFAEALARACERTRARILAGTPVLGDLFGTFTAFTEAHPEDNARSHTAVEPQPEGARADPAGERITLDELLPVFRDPIEWALARAERHAQGDPLDLAALGRVRAAYQSRLAWIGSDGALGAARPTLRPTDVLTVVGLAIRSIDPSFAQRTSIGMREGLLDALAQVIPLGMACAPDAAAPPHPSGPFHSGNHIPVVPAPFGPPHIARPIVAMCCGRCGHVF